MKLKLPAQFPLIVCALVLLNVIQAAITPLIFDEAYYWHFARDMAWGYFDHPPMVAVIIKLGSLLFSGELGVRFISCLFSGAIAIVLWKTIDPPRKAEFVPHFFILLFSMVLMNAYGFLTLPDTPLLFFTALFLLLYKKFLSKPGWGLALGLGLVMAALMYSKYHAFLVIFFVGISNIHLLKSRYTWAAVAIALLAYLPHVWWLAANDFVSIKYHLFDRPNRAYEFADFTLGYLVNLVAIFGFTFPWIYLALYKSTKAKGNFNRALLFLTYGVLIFFLVSSFDRRVQTQWIIVVCIPLFLIAFHQLAQNPRLKTYLMVAGVLNGIVILVLRVGLVYQPLFPIVYETHGNKEWVAKIANAARGVPVVFENSYRRAPMYAFYSGEPSFSLNNIMYRRNQYSIDDSESRVRDQAVYYVTPYPAPGAEVFNTRAGDTLYGKHIAYFKPYRKLAAETLARDESEILFRVYNPYQRSISLGELNFGMAFLNEYKQIIHVKPLDAAPTLLGSRQIPANAYLDLKGRIPNASTAEARYYKLTIAENGLYWGLNGSTEKLKDGD